MRRLFMNANKMRAFLFFLLKNQSVGHQIICFISLRVNNLPVIFFLQITCAGKCNVRQGVQPVALELHICEYRLRMSDTLAVISPAAEISLLDGDTVLLEDATRVRDERGGKVVSNAQRFSPTSSVIQYPNDIGYRGEFETTSDSVTFNCFVRRLSQAGH